MKRYYIGEPPEKPRGPFHLDELRGFFEQGEISPDTPVIEEGASAWGKYRDLRAAERTREVADAMAEKAAKVVAAFQREESRSFIFGFLLGIVHLLTLPWQLIRGAATSVSLWGSSRFIAVSEDRLALAVIGKIARPVCILLWTAWWVGDSLSILLAGRPSVTMFIISSIGNLVFSGTPGSGVMELLDSPLGFLRIREFGDRVTWMAKLACIGYCTTVFIAIAGEFFAALAGVGKRGEAQQSKAEQ